MRRPLWTRSSVVLLLACLAAVPACGKKTPEGDTSPGTEPGTDPKGGTPGPTPGPGAPSAADRARAVNNFKQLGLALHMCNDANTFVPVYANHMPFQKPTDKPRLSWRVEILPFLEQEALYKEFKLDEPWDSEHNKKLIEKMPKVYAPVGRAGKPGYTHAQMVVGPGALKRPIVRIPASFPDGLSNTIAVVEAAEPVIWTKPDDIMFGDTEPPKDPLQKYKDKGTTGDGDRKNTEPPKDFRKKFGGQFPGGFHVVLWDGMPRFIPDSMSDRTLALALNPNDGQPMPAEWDPKQPNKK
jgi:hypothetical protein